MAHGAAELKSEKLNDYIQKGVNVRRTEKPRAGCVVEACYRGMLHLGYMVADDTVLHATFDGGVKTTALAFFRAVNFYEVQGD